GTPLPCASQAGTNVFFTGCNVNVRSGSVSTDGTVNSKGNLIIGYNENSCAVDRTDCSSVADCQPNPCDLATTTGQCRLTRRFCMTDADCEANVCGGKTGSHNLVVGPGHSYPSFGGILGGSHNATAGPSSSVTGGFRNVASDYTASVSGGSC